MCLYDNQAVSECHFQIWKHFNTDEFTPQEVENVLGIDHTEVFHFVGMLCGWKFFTKSYLEDGTYYFNMTPEGAAFASAHWGHKLKQED